MSREVYCVRLKCQAEGLDFVPWPGDLGQRIFQQISKQAWQEWLAHQTMLINENRLNPLDPEARAWLTEEMQKFLFSGTADRPPGYVPESDGAGQD